MSTSRCTVLTGCVSVPGFALLPTVDATRLHGLPAACPDDDDSPMFPNSSRPINAAAARHQSPGQAPNPLLDSAPAYGEYTASDDSG